MDEKRLRYKYILADVFTALMAWLLFHAFRRLEVDALQMGIHLLYPQYNARVVVALIPFFWLSIYAVSGYYNDGCVLFKSRINEFATTLVSTFIGVLILFFCIVLDDPIDEVGFSYFYISFFLLFFLQFLLTYVFRLSITQSAIRMIRKGQITQATLVIGTGAVAQKIHQDSQRLLLSGYNLVGFVKVSNDEVVEVPSSLCVGTWDQLKEIVQARNVSVVIIADEHINPLEVYKLIATFRYHTLSIKVIPSQFDWLKGSVDLSNVQGIPLVDITKSRISPWQMNVKRLFDVVFSLVALVLTLPFMAIFCLMIGKKPIFKQERIGQRGKPFYIYKLRSMRLDAEKDGPQLSSETDSRITPIGRFLRKYRIDELPQFYNVLKGDMSVVGPRPEREFYIKQIAQRAPYYYMLSKIKPGITSLGMVKYGYANTLEKMLVRVNFELLYLDKMSLAFDAKIMIYTIKTIFLGKGV